MTLVLAIATYFFIGLAVARVTYQWAATSDPDLAGVRWSGADYSITFLIIALWWLVVFLFIVMGLLYLIRKFIVYDFDSFKIRRNLVKMEQDLSEEGTPDKH